MGVPVEESLSVILMNYRRVVIKLEYDFDEVWINSVGEGWRTQSVYQWVEWLTITSPEDELPNIDWLIALFTKTKRIMGRRIPVLSHSHI